MSIDAEFRWINIYRKAQLSYYRIRITNNTTREFLQKNRVNQLHEIRDQNQEHLA